MTDPRDSAVTYCVRYVCVADPRDSAVTHCVRYVCVADPGMCG